MEIQHSSLAWTTVEFQGFISWPNQTPDRIRLPPLLERTSQDLASPHLLCCNPFIKPFSGLPSRRSMTSPTREAGDAVREKPGIVYPLLPRATRPDTRVVIEAALPEAAALDCRAQPPTVLEIGETNLPQRLSSPRQRPSRSQSHKHRCNRSTGVYRPPKRSPPQGHWCE